MKWIIDRIENDIVVCEAGDNYFLDIPLNALPDGVKEGDVINVSIDNAETYDRKKKIDGLMNSLFKD